MTHLSIIISTRNRCTPLAATLASMHELVVPDNCSAELLVVDNGSTDGTRECIKKWVQQETPIRTLSLHVGTPGKSNALNAAVAAASGEIVLFTDDDVIPSPDWLVNITGPVLRNEFDAVRGGVSLAPHLHRSWMTPTHRWWLASSQDAEPCEGHLELIGANMGVHRRVFDRVPAFDPDLGPGAIGLGEDSLFSWQLHEAGYRIGSVPDAHVVHHLAERRLARAEWLKAAAVHGETGAYRSYHWLHDNRAFPRIEIAKALTKLLIKRCLLKPERTAEGCPLWELCAVEQIAHARRLVIEAKRQRRYAFRGLRLLEPSSGSVLQ